MHRTVDRTAAADRFTRIYGKDRPTPRGPAGARMAAQVDALHQLALCVRGRGGGVSGGLWTTLKGILGGGGRIDCSGAAYCEELLRM